MSAENYFERSKREEFMKCALEEAQIAFSEGEAPIGAVVVKDGKIISRARNQVEKLKDPTAHAEILAIKKATAALGDKFLTDCELYVTLEPCPMCSGAIVLARLKIVAFGAFDAKMGGASSLYSIVQDDRLNHRCEVIFGLLQDESSDLLKKFFREKR